MIPHENLHAVAPAVDEYEKIPGAGIKAHGIHYEVRQSIESKAHISRIFAQEYALAWRKRNHAGMDARTSARDAFVRTRQPEGDSIITELENSS